jgi:hypothetical protein
MTKINKIAVAIPQTDRNGITLAGVTKDRPSSPEQGQTFFDVSINRAIWFNGVAWIDALGTPV